jgi:hypothetical protein
MVVYEIKLKLFKDTMFLAIDPKIINRFLGIIDWCQKIE